MAAKKYESILDSRIRSRFRFFVCCGRTTPLLDILKQFAVLQPPKYDNHFMPNKSLSMSRIRQILRCYAAGKGTKTIANMFDLSRNTVKKYITIFNQSGKSMEEVLELDDQQLNEMFKASKTSDCHSERYTALMDEMPEYVRLLKKRNSTRNSVYEVYASRHPEDASSKSQFCRVLQIYQVQSGAIAHIEHKAGDRMYVDFAGDKLYIVDKESGEQLPIEIFVAILPCSQLTYVEAVMSQKKEDFIKACENAFYFYGGTPQVIVPDNLKAAVSHPNKYESELNEDFAAFANHYGCTVMPTRVRCPKDKALVEGAVKLIYRTIYPEIEDKTFFDLEAMNAAIRVALEIHNNTKLTGRTTSRREQYEDFERCCMGPLNPIRFELRQRARLTVQRNGYVRLDKHYYSVPYQLIEKKVNVLYNTTEVIIYYKYEVVAKHKRGVKQYGFTTNPEHLPKSQQNYLEWDPEKLLDEADQLGEGVRDFFEKIISQKKIPGRGVQALQGPCQPGSQGRTGTYGQGMSPCSDPAPVQLPCCRADTDQQAGEHADRL